MSEAAHCNIGLLLFGDVMSHAHTGKRQQEDGTCQLSCYNTYMHSPTHTCTHTEAHIHTRTRTQYVWGVGGCVRGGTKATAMIK